MDNQNIYTPNMPQESPGFIKRVLSRRNIFIILGIVILVEVIWVFGQFSKPQTTPTPPVVTQETEEKITTISLIADKTNLKVGDKVNVSINFSSDKLSDGADLIINYDPKVLQIETINDQAVIAGNIYDSYPLNSVDSLGKITVSGIAEATTGVLADGQFGTIVFTAIGSGRTKVSVEFSEGSTADSNVTESGTSLDVLQNVNDLELNILP